LTDIVKVALIAAAPGIVSAVVGLFNRSKLQDVGARVDGRLSELLELTRTSSHADGMKDQKENSPKG
jgi:hypothetical protein